MTVISHFERSDTFERALAPCIDKYDCGDPMLYEWPNNVLSVNTVVYESGRIARAGDTVTHRVDSDELALCQRIAAELGAMLGSHTVQMKSESDDPWTPYFNVADIEAPVPETLDEASLRAYFGGTIHPADRVVVEPLQPRGQWWEDLAGGDSDADYVTCWRLLVDRVSKHPELHGACFAMVGFGDYGEPVEEPDAPGFEMMGSCLPRLALAITARGSLVGLLGHVTWT